MPRRRQPPASPPSPPPLPPIPAGAYPKKYYPYPDTVYYLATGEGPIGFVRMIPADARLPETDTEWRRGTVSNDTKSTKLHVVSTCAWPTASC